MTAEPPRTIRLFGELDIHSAREMGATLSEAVGDVSRGLVVDLRRVTFIDSTALGALVRAGEQMRNQGRVVPLVVTPGGQVEGVLDSTGLRERFEVVNDPAEIAPGSTQHPPAAADTNGR